MIFTIVKTKDDEFRETIELETLEDLINFTNKLDFLNIYYGVDISAGTITIVE